MALSTALSELFALLARRWRFALGVFLLLAAGTISLILIMPPRYVAQSTLLAKFGREYLTKEGASGAGLAPANFGQEDIVSSVVEIMRTQSLADQVVHQMGASVLYPGLRQSGDDGIPLERLAALRFAAALSVSPARRSNVIVARFANTDPKVAAEALNLYIQAFETKYLALYGENRVDFLSRDLKRLQGELAAAQDAMTAFERDHRSYFRDGQLDVLGKRRTEVETQRARAFACCADTAAAADLAKQVAELDRRIADASANQDTLRLLARRRDLAQEAYDSASKRLQEAQITRNMDEGRITSVEVIEPASPPARQAPPSRLVKIILALGLSAIAAVAATFLAQILSVRFATAAQLRQAFTLPVLADIPSWNSDQR